jgi:hypothetical protein
MLEVQQRRSISSRIRNSLALALARAGIPMKQTPEVLEHGWTRRSGTQIAAVNLTAAQAKEQVEYDKAVQRALKAMGY